MVICNCKTGNCIKELVNQRRSNDAQGRPGDPRFNAQDDARLKAISDWLDEHGVTGLSEVQCRGEGQKS